MEYNKLLEKANVGVKKVVDYINENKSMFDCMDLKLHDASFYCYDNMKNDFPLCYESGIDYFSRFCDESYEIFIEWCNEEYIDFSKMIKPLGRTSKFYLNEWYDNNIDFMLYDIIGNIGCWWYADYFNLYNGIVSIDEDMDIKDSVEPLEYLAKEFYNDFMNAIEDIKKVYDYIIDFKEKQVEYFKDFLSYYEDCYQYEKEQAEAEQTERRKVCINIQRKYGILDKEMKILKENIMYF